MAAVFAEHPSHAPHQLSPQQLGEVSSDVTAQLSAGSRQSQGPRWGCDSGAGFWTERSH